MKKVILSLAVIFSVAMVSCGGNKAEKAADTAAEAVVEEAVAVAVDSVSPDSVDTTVAVAAEVAEAPAEAK